jgi:hypothetical protein
MTNDEARTALRSLMAHCVVAWRRHHQECGFGHRRRWGSKPSEILDFIRKMPTGARALTLPGAKAPLGESRLNYFLEHWGDHSDLESKICPEDRTNEGEEGYHWGFRLLQTWEPQSEPPLPPTRFEREDVI